MSRRWGPRELGLHRLNKGWKRHRFQTRILKLKLRRLEIGCRGAISRSHCITRSKSIFCFRVLRCIRRQKRSTSYRSSSCSSVHAGRISNGSLRSKGLVMKMLFPAGGWQHLEQSRICKGEVASGQWHCDCACYQKILQACGQLFPN